MRRNSEGQVSVEFMVALSMLMLILVFSVWVYGERNEGFLYSKQYHWAKTSADNLAGTINAVYVAGHGAETKLVLEKYFDFNIALASNAVLVEWENGSVDSALITGDVNLISATPGGWVNVRNIDNNVVIEDA